MSASTVRVYSTRNEDPDDIEEFLFSVVADDTSARYVFPTEPDDDWGGLNSERIQEILSAHYPEGAPTTAEQWAFLASSDINGMFYDGPEYDSIEDAVAGELPLLKRAQEIREIPDDIDEEEEAVSDV